MRSPSHKAIDAALKRIAPLSAETIAERALVAAWLRTTGGDQAILKRVVADAILDANAALGPTTAVADVHPWVEAGLMSTPQPRHQTPAVQWARTPSSVRRWVIEAKPGEILTYHVGRLATDRAENPVLSATADYVSTLDHLGAVRALTARTSLQSCAVYCAQRRSGHARHPLVLGLLTPVEYRALLALQQRERGVSALKAIERSAAAISPQKAQAILEALLERGAVRQGEGKPGHQGYELTARGAAMVEGEG